MSEDRAMNCPTCGTELIVGEATVDGTHYRNLKLCVPCRFARATDEKGRVWSFTGVEIGQRIGDNFGADGDDITIREIDIATEEIVS